MTNYQNLHVYQLAYKTAIDLHLLLESPQPKLKDDVKKSLLSHSRTILSELATGFQETNSKTKRFHNFVALDFVRRLQADLEFLNDTKILTGDVDSIVKSYAKVQKKIFKLNRELLEQSTAK